MKNIKLPKIGSIVIWNGAYKSIGVVEKIDDKLLHPEYWLNLIPFYGYSYLYPSDFDENGRAVVICE